MAGLHPFVARFDLPTTDAALAARVRVTVAPMTSLAALDPETAEQVLIRHLGAVYEPAHEDLKLLRTLTAIAKAHALLTYPDGAAYLGGINAQEPPLAPADFFCMTGLAGLGKTALIEAFKRLVCGFPTYEPGAGHPVETLEAIWYLKADSGSRFGDMVRHALGKHIDGFPVNSHSKLERIASRLAFKLGVSIILPDELQFLSRSPTANALLASTMGRIRDIGVPTVGVFNFSMCHRMMKRPQEDRDRFLSHPIIMQPIQRSDPWTAKICKAYHEATGGALFDNLNAQIEQFYDYTLNLRRKGPLLLSIAYRHARQRGVERVCSCDLETAYRSPEYAASRTDLTDIFEQWLHGHQVRPDLWCPFGEPQTLEAAHRVEAQQAARQRVNEKAVVSSMSRAERLAYNEEKKQDSAKACGTKGASPPHRTRRPKMIREDVLRDANRWAQLARGSASP